MLTDLVQIRRLGEQKRPENERLRQHMKRHGYVERHLRKIAEDIDEEMDCTTCANCCRQATVRLIERDVERLSKALGIKPARFFEEYAEESEEEGVILRRTEQGCVFLTGNHCSVYEDRPTTCLHFPHTVRGEGSLPSRMWQMIDRATYCPIVYNTLEAWKVDVKFNR